MSSCRAGAAFLTVCLYVSRPGHVQVAEEDRGGEPGEEPARGGHVRPRHLQYAGRARPVCVAGRRGRERRHCLIWAGLRVGVAAVRGTAAPCAAGPGPARPVLCHTAGGSAGCSQGVGERTPCLQSPPGPGGCAEPRCVPPGLPSLLVLFLLPSCAGRVALWSPWCEPCLGRSFPALCWICGCFRPTRGWVTLTTDPSLDLHLPR